MNSNFTWQLGWSPVSAKITLSRKKKTRLTYLCDRRYFYNMEQGSKHLAPSKSPPLPVEPGREECCLPQCLHLQSFQLPEKDILGSVSWRKAYLIFKMYPCEQIKRCLQVFWGKCSEKKEGRKAPLLIFKFVFVLPYTFSMYHYLDSSPSPQMKYI